MEQLQSVDHANSHELVGSYNVMSAESREFIHRVAHELLSGFPLVRRWNETDDVCQEAAARMHSALQVMEPESRRHFENLVALQIRRTLIDLARKQLRTVDQCPSRWTPQEPFLRVDDVLNDFGDDAADSDSLSRWTRLHECVEEIPEPDRETFQLMWYRGLRRCQIAEMMGVDVSTVQRRWRSARQFLMRRLGEGFLSPGLE